VRARLALGAPGALVWKVDALGCALRA